MIRYREGYTYQLAEDYAVFGILIDQECVNIINQFTWRIAKTTKRGSLYAMSKKNNKAIYMHRLIIDAKKGEVVDHINGNGLDNRKSNLRIVTHKQNAWNIGKKSNGTTSKYLGVGWVNKDKAYQARIRTDSGIRISLGYFDNEIDAAKAYNRKAIELRGEYARLNEV